MPRAGNAHLNSEGGRFTYWFDLLSLQDLLVRNQLHLCVLSFFQHQNNLVQTIKDRRSAVCDSSPDRIKVRVPCLESWVFPIEPFTLLAGLHKM